jgi:hypothetical protein
MNQTSDGADRQSAHPASLKDFEPGVLAHRRGVLTLGIGLNAAVFTMLKGSRSRRSQELTGRPDSTRSSVKRARDARFPCHIPTTSTSAMWRDDILAHACALSQANGGAPGVDGETCARIEATGRERWLGELREEVLDLYAGI